MREGAYRQGAARRLAGGAEAGAGRIAARAGSAVRERAWRGRAAFTDAPVADRVAVPPDRIAALAPADAARAAGAARAQSERR